MKKLSRIIFAVFLTAVLICTAAAATLPQATDGFFVNDFAGILQKEDASAMQAQGEALYKQCGAQVVVVTISTLDGEDIADYALSLARKWGIGSKDKNNGVLLLLSTEEPHVRIEVGTGLEGALPDSKAGRLLDKYMMPNYTADTFSTGLRETYNALVNEVCIEYGLEPTDENYVPEEEDEDTPLMLFLPIAFIILIIVLSAVFGRRFPGGGGGFPGGFPGGGGGFSGGGSGFSGGGGGFSGGGGGFSGGGASR